MHVKNLPESRVEREASRISAFKASTFNVSGLSESTNARVDGAEYLAHEREHSPKIQTPCIAALGALGNALHLHVVAVGTQCIYLNGSNMSTLAMLIAPAYRRVSSSEQQAVRMITRKTNCANRLTNERRSASGLNQGGGGICMITT